MSLVKRSERVTSSWKGAIADIAIRSMPNPVERLLVTDRPIILTAIKTMKPTISTIFLENIDMLCCAHPHTFCGVHSLIMEKSHNSIILLFRYSMVEVKIPASRISCIFSGTAG